MANTLFLANRFAKEEAELFNHEFIGTEHLLLAVFRLGDNTGTKLLARHRINLRRLRLLVVRLIQLGPIDAQQKELLMTPRAIIAIEYAEEIARINSQQFNAEHLFLGIIHDRESVACQLLTTVGITDKQLNECYQDLKT